MIPVKIIFFDIDGTLVDPQTGRVPEPELVNDVIRNNGFIPLPSNDSEWIPFKWQGEVFFVSTNSLPGIQFYKGFSYKDDDNQDILKKAAEMTMDELWYGRITFSEEDDVMAFRVFALE